MSFLAIATPFINMGIPVFPLSPGTKVPPLGLAFLTAATTDPSKVAAWDEENPEYNVALASGDYCFLEFDQLGIKSAAEEMGQSVPVTRTQKSGSGGGHFIFKSTDRSRTLGNRSATLNGREWFSFRARNKYLVGAGSIHPNGNPYKTVRDVAPAPVPDWVVDFVAKHSVPEKASNKGQMPELDECFDPDKWYDFNDIGGYEDGNWFIPHDGCVVAGYRHENSTRTGFFYDGTNWGWHCFAGGCPGCEMSIGEVVSFVNHQRRERGLPIWSKPIWKQDDSDLEGVDNVDDDDLNELNDCLVETTQAKPEVGGYPGTVGLFRLSDDSFAEAEPGKEQEPEKDETTSSGLKQLVATTNDDFTIALITRSAADYELEELRWLWPNKIPLGKVVLFTGKPDCGKSMCALDVIARVTTGGDWPDGTKNETGAAKVLVAASEDDPHDTLIPRLKAAGADLRKVEIVVFTVLTAKGKKQRKSTLNLKRDAKMLIAALKANPDIKLLVLDPITSFLGDADQNKDKDVRPIMDALKSTCEKSGLTIIGIIHSNKRSDVDAVHKVSGAGSLAASVRAVWGFSRDPEDKSLFRMAHVKGNLTRDKTGLDYTIAGVPVIINGNAVDVPRVNWGEQCDMDADELLKRERNNKDAKDVKAEAAKILIKAQRFPVQAKKVYELAELQGISGTTVKNARAALNHEGYATVAKKHEGVWWWHMADEPTSQGESTMEDKFAVEDLL